MSLTGLNPYALKDDTTRQAERERLSASLAAISATVTPDAAPDVLYAAEDAFITLVDTLEDRMHTGHLTVPEFDTLLRSLRDRQDVLYLIYRIRGL